MVAVGVLLVDFGLADYKSILHSFVQLFFLLGQLHPLRLCFGKIVQELFLGDLFALALLLLNSRIYAAASFVWLTGRRSLSHLRRERFDRLWGWL